MCLRIFAMFMRVHGRPEEAIRSPRAGVTRGCEPPSVDAGSQIQVLYKNSVFP